MNYQIGICCDCIKEYELFFEAKEQADIAAYIARIDKAKYNDIYKIDYVAHDYNDHRVYVVCGNLVLHTLLEKINYALQDYCDVDETVEWEWL